MGIAAGAAGAAGFAAGGAVAGTAAGALGATGAAAGAVATGAAGFPIGVTGVTVLVAGTTLTAGGAAGAAGLILAAFAAASFASFSALAVASACASASACPRRFLRTFSATSTGIELECVFFSVTPYPGNRSIMALALTSSSRASSLIRTWFASVMLPFKTWPLPPARHHPCSVQALPLLPAFLPRQLLLP
jgi:hypothetical protein